MEDTPNTKPVYASTGVVRMFNSDEVKPNQQGIEIWSDFLHLIPHIQATRSPDYNAAIKRGKNSSVLLLSFIMIDGFLWKFIETVIYKLQIDKQGDEGIQQILNDHLKSNSWEIDKKISLINQLLNTNIKQINVWNSIKILRDFRNIVGHGGEISISSNDLNSDYYLFEQDVCKNMLLKTGIIKQQDTDKITEEHFNLLFSDSVADYYFDKSKNFLKELNLLNPNEENKNFLSEHFFNF